MNAAAAAPAAPRRVHGRSGRATALMPDRHDPIRGLVLSVALHGAMLLLGGWLWTRPAGYGVTEGASAIEVELIAAPRASPVSQETAVIRPQEAVLEPESTVVESESEPAIEPEPIPVTETRPEEIAPAAVVQPAAPSHPGPMGDGSSPVPGKDAVSQRASAGAQIAAKPSYLRNPAPRYPEAARRAGEEGLVLLEVVVDRSGRPREVTLLTGSGYERLDRSALAAVRRWIFEPARVGPLAVESTVQVPVRFRLDDPVIS